MGLLDCPQTHFLLLSEATHRIRHKPTTARKERSAHLFRSTQHHRVSGALQPQNPPCSYLRPPTAVGQVSGRMSPCWRVTEFQPLLPEHARFCFRADISMKLFAAAAESSWVCQDFIASASVVCRCVGRQEAFEDGVVMAAVFERSLPRLGWQRQGSKWGCQSACWCCICECVEVSQCNLRSRKKRNGGEEMESDGRSGGRGGNGVEGVRGIHAHMMQRGRNVERFEENRLMGMYVKCGSMGDAQHVFDMMSERSVVSWNTMILGYAKKEKGELALELYAQMQQEGFKPSQRSFMSALKACSSLATLEEGAKVECLMKGRAIHSQIVQSGFETDMFVGTSLVDMYAKCGSMGDAQYVFDKLPRRDVVSWNAMIKGRSDKEEAEMALYLYAQMQQEGVTPNGWTFVGTLKACSSLVRLEEGKSVKRGCLEKGRAIHSQVVNGGFVSDVFVGNTLVDMYAKCGSMEEARSIFGKIPHRDVVSWNALIEGYAEHGDSGEALKLYAEMQNEGLSANSWTFVSVLKACGNTAALETGRQIHAQLRRVGLETTAIVATTLIDMYGKCGCMVDARRLFDALHKRDLVAWSALIAGYARQGELEIVVDMFERMRQEVRPNGVTFSSVLTVCSHAGAVDQGLNFFQAMHRECGIVPTIEHYTCMVDLLGRAGHVEEAAAMVNQMPFQPDLVVWRTLLAACRKWNNVDIGRHAFQCALRLDGKDTAAYVLMSNIYADAHMWEESDKMQAMRKDARAWKVPGQSCWTDMGGVVHAFVVGDGRHTQSKDIYAKLKDLYVKMEEEGYVPNLESVLWDLSDHEKQDALCGHSEKLAISYALLNTPAGTTIRIVKNLRVCDDCHKAIALISKIERRNIICRDASRFHNYKDGKCSCGDYW